jgi:hypothetical protein
MLALWIKPQVLFDVASLELFENDSGAIVGESGMEESWPCKGI